MAKGSMVRSELIRIRMLISIINIKQDKALTLGWVQLSFPVKRPVPNITWILPLKRRSLQKARWEAYAVGTYFA